MESVVQSQWLRLDQGQWLGLDQGKVSRIFPVILANTHKYS